MYSNPRLSLRTRALVLKSDPLLSSEKRWSIGVKQVKGRSFGWKSYLNTCKNIFIYQVDINIYVMEEIPVQKPISKSLTQVESRSHHNKIIGQ